MASPKKSASWQAMRRALSSKNKTGLLNLIRDLYALNTENQDVVRTQALAPKMPQRHQATVKAIEKSPASKAAPKIRRLAQVAAELREGSSLIEGEGAFGEGWHGGVSMCWVVSGLPSGLGTVYN
jgi:hypothetical protein